MREMFLFRPYDKATIINTYPDHEDVQGPAGIDIPRVMTEFIAPTQHRGKFCPDNKGKLDLLG